MTTSVVDEYVQEFTQQRKEMEAEFARLTQLLHEVCWYNYATVCKLEKDPTERIELTGHRYSKQMRNGHECECNEFPVYYEGKVTEAPAVPPQIVLHDMEQAWLEIDRLKELVKAPHDWAPGGGKYEELCKTTAVGKIFHAHEENGERRL